jgi:hypothetical protein
MPIHYRYEFKLMILQKLQQLPEGQGSDPTCMPVTRSTDILRHLFVLPLTASWLLELDRYL